MVHRAKFRMPRTVWSLGAAAALLAGTAVMYATPRGKHEANTQEKEWKLRRPQLSQTSQGEESAC